MPADPRALADLAVLVARARRADPEGAARLVAVPAPDGGGVLAVSVSPLHGPGLPTVLGMRALALRGPARLDVTVALAALAERLARTMHVLPVPPVQVLTASWPGLAPPRGGWQALEPVAAHQLRAAAAEGAAQVAAGAPRTSVWTRPLAGQAGAAGGTTALALAADVLGFLPGEGAPSGSGGAAAPGGEVAAARSGPWVRLSTARGHVLARPPMLL